MVCTIFVVRAERAEMRISMQQLLLPLLADATAIILDADNCHTIYFLHLHQYL